MRCYAVRGNLENVALLPAVEYEQLPSEHHTYFLPEANAQGYGVREFPKLNPKWWKFRAEPDENQNGEFRFDDAISSTSGIPGIDNYISGSAVKKLAPYVGGECEFHPANIDGAPEPYYAMWVRPFLEAIDLSRAQVRPVEYIRKNGQNPLQLLSYEFSEEQVKDRLLFRLAGYSLDDTSLHDYATEKFMELVKQLKVTGFHFYPAKFDFKALIPVKPRHQPI